MKKPTVYIVNMMNFDIDSHLPKDIPPDIFNRGIIWFNTVEKSLNALINGKAPAINIRCHWKYFGEKCPGLLEGGIMRDESNIAWRCPICGRYGRISGFIGTAWDPFDDGKVFEIKELEKAMRRMKKTVI